MMAIYNFLRKKRNRRKIKRILIILLSAFIVLKTFSYMGNEKAKNLEREVEAGAKKGAKEVQSIYNRYK